MGPVLEPWAINTLLMCFGGGIVGAAFGALFSFALCAFIVLTGCLVALAGGGDFILLQVGLGPVFAPHTGGFAAGVAAVTYAQAIKKNEPNYLGLGARDIFSPLIGTSWDVLVVGGLFALLGHSLVQLFAIVPIVRQFDLLALSIIVTAMIARGVFQKQAPWGDMESIKKHGYLGTDNHAISWVPWMSPWSRLTVFGLGWGLFSGCLAWGTKSVLDPMVVAGTASATAAFVVPLIIGWGIAGFCLIGLNLAGDLPTGGPVAKFPVQHHIALLAALAYLHFGEIWVAGLVGILGAFLGELLARMFWNHGANHIDPPANAIAWGTLLLWIASLVF